MLNGLFVNSENRSVLGKVLGFVRGNPGKFLDKGEFERFQGQF